MTAMGRYCFEEYKHANPEVKLKFVKHKQYQSIELTANYYY